MGSLFVIRHAQASFGQADYDALSTIGQQQAQILGRVLAQSGLRFDRVLQGSMQRHQETARLALLEMASPPAAETFPWLNEFDHSAVMRSLHADFADPVKVRARLQHEAEPAKAFHKVYEQAMERWMSGKYDGDYPETFSQFKERCVQGLRAVLQSSPAEAQILLFTSGGPIAGLMQLALDLSDAMMLRLTGAIVNGSISRLSFKNDRLFVSYFNDHAHFGKSASALLTYR